MGLTLKSFEQLSYQSANLALTPSIQLRGNAGSKNCLLANKQFFEPALPRNWMLGVSAKLAL